MASFRELVCAFFLFFFYNVNIVAFLGVLVTFWLLNNRAVIITSVKEEGICDNK
jgi:hypothetical protein